MVANISKVLQDSSPLLGIRESANGVLSTGFSSPWMGLVASDDSPSPTTPSSGRLSGLWNIKEEHISPPRNDESQKTERTSKSMERLIDRTGQLAAESRIHSEMVERKPAIPYEPQSSAASVKYISEHQSNDQEKGVEVRKSLAEIRKTLRPNINWRTRVILITGAWRATIHAICQPVLSFILLKLLHTYSALGGQKHKALIFSMAVLSVAAWKRSTYTSSECAWSMSASAGSTLSVPKP
jgi:hypothetical protein